MRLSSVCQRASSSRASSARLASAWSMAGLNSLSSGRTQWRMRLRVKASSAFVESVRQLWLRDSRKSDKIGAADSEQRAQNPAGALGNVICGLWALRRDLWALRREL